ncbi:MAG: hypothetical protein V3W31_09270, partial [Thermodesulfobacteriota bacterium]
AVVYRTGSISTWGNFFTNNKRRIRALGPPVFCFPLAVMAVAPLWVAYAAEALEPLSISLLSAGLLIFIHSLVLIKRKRAIENCPTSRIRTMPMGTVEVAGRARRKFAMKSPYTNTDCVYYSYKVYDRVRVKNGYRYVLKEWGDSGNIPFYVEDDTGRVLVLPNEAIIRGGRSETLRGDYRSSFFAAGQGIHISDGKVEETVIPEGESLYVMGFAHRMRISFAEKRRKFIERLKALKSDKTRLRQYDADMDGKINDEEWETAKKDVEDKMLAEKLASKKNEDNIAIGPYPSGGLFYISDKHEEAILDSMAWRIPLFLTLGLAGTTGGGIYLLQVLRHGDILGELQRLFG